jgi:hypothetical protein
MLILVPTAMAQDEMTMMMEETTMMEKDLPKSGGVPVGSIVLPPRPARRRRRPGYAVLRRR